MRAKEIREKIAELQEKHKKASSPDLVARDAPIIQAFALWEIAAQLAEMNDRERIDLSVEADLARGGGA